MNALAVFDRSLLSGFLREQLTPFKEYAARYHVTAEEAEALALSLDGEQPRRPKEERGAIELAQAEEAALVEDWNRKYPHGAMVRACLPTGGTVQGRTVGAVYLDGCLAYVWIKGLPYPVWLGWVEVIEGEV